MNKPTQPVPATADLDPNRTPRMISHPQMRDHQENRLVTLLSDRARHHMFVHYDDVWWIGDRDGFIEITSTDHNRKLDRWHERLTNGALWE
jgi:hypothetical protein